jgi:hypothetical protein
VHAIFEDPQELRVLCQRNWHVYEGSHALPNAVWFLGVNY